jgi:acetyltransferase-like isoleucine patch superfamily enzyme
VRAPAGRHAAITEAMSWRDVPRDAGYHLLLRLCNALLRCPGHAFRLSVLRHLARCSIADGCAVERSVTITGKGGVRVGAGTNVNRGVLLDGRGGLLIGAGVNISPEAMLLTAEHDVRSAVFAGRTLPVAIGDRAWIATRAIVLPGTTVGEGAVIGAGAVVRGQIPARTVWAGNPARKIADRPADAQRRMTRYRRWFH